MGVLNLSRKTLEFSGFDKKASYTRLSKFLKTRSLLFVNDCFKNENNAVDGVFLLKPERGPIVLNHNQPVINVERTN